MKFGAVANRARRDSLVVLKPWLKAVEAEQMVGQELSQGHGQIASISLGRWVVLTECEVLCRLFQRAAQTSLGVKPVSSGPSS